MVFVVSGGLVGARGAGACGAGSGRVLDGLRADGWRIAPLVIVRHGRVAIGDAVAAALRRRCAVVLIGERPGLSAPDSMGAYLTWGPNPQTTDAERNCISNIRPGGIGYADAATRSCGCSAAMRARRRSGVRLKDSDTGLIGS